MIGELGLDGSLRPVPGVLAMADALRQAGTSAVLLPADNAPEATLVGGMRVFPATSLAQARAALKGEEDWPALPSRPARTPADNGDADDLVTDLAVVRGLSGGRKALEVAAAGGHHLFMVGPPGAGKTLLARCLPSILPLLDDDESLEVTRIHSAAGQHLQGQLVRARPFRAPHHTASAAALVGGGRGRPTPGEVTLAHKGTLFLDELGEFSPLVLDALRQPLEERVVRISRQGAAVAFPADFLLIACSNPCPCGLEPPRCICSESHRLRYRPLPRDERAEAHGGCQPLSLIASTSVWPSALRSPTTPLERHRRPRRIAWPKRSLDSAGDTGIFPGGATPVSRRRRYDARFH